MEIIRSLNAIFTLAIMLAVGVYAHKKKWIDDSASKVLAKICISVAIPSNVFYSLISNYDREKLLSVVASINIPIIAIMLAIVLGSVLAILGKVPKGRRGLFVGLSAFSNTIFMGIPIVTSILGSEALAYLPIYYVANTLLFWTIGLYLIKRDAKVMAKESGETMNEGPKTIGKMILSVCQYFINPVIILFFVATALILFSVKLPIFVVDSFRYFSSSSTALSMLYIGGYLYKIFSSKDVKNFYVKDMILIVSVKFILLPVIVYFTLKQMDLPILLNRTFLLLSIMPSMNQTVILSASHKADSEFAVVSNIITLLFTPIPLIAFAVLSAVGFI